METLVDSEYATENLPLVEALLDHGGNPNACGYDGDTLLYIAAGRHFSKTVNLLLDRGADPNLASSHGYALLVADAASSKILLYHGARVDARLEDQPTAFAYSVAYQTDAKSAVLLSHGARVDHLDAVTGNSTVLDGIASYGTPKDIKRILHWGARVDARDLFGGTALMHAVTEANVPNVRALLVAHADVSLVNSDRESALDIAEAGLRDHRGSILHTGPADADWRQVIALLRAAQKHSRRSHQSKPTASHLSLTRPGKRPTGAGALTSRSPTIRQIRQPHGWAESDFIPDNVAPDPHFGLEKE
jgi:ankyrin repeat protein